MLTEAEVRAFRRGGLTDIEIGMINEGLRTRPQEIDPFNDAWQLVFYNRLNYIRSQLHIGKSLRQITDKINSFVRAKDRGQSPWDFLREAYPIKGGKKTDFVKRAEARSKIVDHFGSRYK